MNFLFERIDKTGTKVASVINVVDLDSFADAVQELIDDSEHNRVTLLLIDKEAKYFPEDPKSPAFKISKRKKKLKKNNDGDDFFHGWEKVIKSMKL